MKISRRAISKLYKQCLSDPMMEQAFYTEVSKMKHKDRLVLWHDINGHIKKLRRIEIMKVGGVFMLCVPISLLSSNPVFLLPTIFYSFWKAGDENLDQRFYDSIQSHIKFTLHRKD